MISTIRLYLVAFSVALLVIGCSAVERPIVMFPLPPETPRIQWLGTYASEDDFEKSGSRVFMENVAGKPPLSGFKGPFGIASDSRGLIYVADSQDANLRVYDLKKKEVNYYSENPYFSRPYGITIDSEDNLYVVDGKMRQVLVFNSEREQLRTIGGPSDFEVPIFVEVDDGRDRVYVTDAKASKVVVFNRIGKKLFEIGPKLTETHLLYNPQGLALDKNGNIFIAEMLSARITVVSPEGKFIRTFGERGDAFFQFEAPKDLAFDSDGNLWVADNRRSQIYTYTPTGELLLATGSGVQGALSFSAPTAITVDAQDRILITDRLNQRFMVWQYRSEAYAAAHPLTPKEKAALEAAARLGKERAERNAIKTPVSGNP